MLSIVVAHSENRVIGNKGQLPWHLPSDLRRFRDLTTGQTVVMGRKTFESLPEAFRPLPDRRNIVVSATPGFSPAGAEVLPTLDAALAACAGRCMVIGGGTIYQQAIPLAQRIYTTYVETVLAGDTFFPVLARNEWSCVDESDPLEENDLRFLFRTYDRTG